MHIFTVHAQKRLFRSFQSIFWPRHSLRRPRFFSHRCIFTTEWRLRDIFYVFELIRHMTLWPWPLTFWPWECFMYGASHARPTYQFLLSYDYRLLSYELLNLITFPLTCPLPMRRITWPIIRGHNGPHFWNPWPKFTCLLCRFRGATTKINLIYWRK